MPERNDFWLPVHEAGHAVAAILWCKNFRFALINVETGAGYTETEQERLDDFLFRVSPKIHGKIFPRDDENYLNMILAGTAAELMVNDLETHITEQTFIPALDKRNRSDRLAFQQAINIQATLSIHNASSISELCIKMAYVNVRPKLQRNLEIFSLVRNHLLRYHYIGKSCMKKIMRSVPVSSNDLIHDYNDIMTIPEGAAQFNQLFRPV